jgi:hypothetical protein
MSPNITAPIVFTSTRARLSSTERYALAAVLLSFIGILLWAWHSRVLDLDLVFSLFPHAELLFWMLIGGIAFIFVFSLVFQHYSARLRLVLDASGVGIESSAPSVLSAFGLGARCLTWPELSQVSYEQQPGLLQLRATGDGEPNLILQVNEWRLESPHMLSTIIRHGRDLSEPDLVGTLRQIGVLGATPADAA